MGIRLDTNTSPSPCSKSLAFGVFPLDNDCRDSVSGTVHGRPLGINSSIGLNGELVTGWPCVGLDRRRPREHKYRTILMSGAVASGARAARLGWGRDPAAEIDLALLHVRRMDGAWGAGL